MTIRRSRRRSSSSLGARLADHITLPVIELQFFDTHDQHGNMHGQRGNDELRA
jgi:hypothetical protein